MSLVKATNLAPPVSLLTFEVQTSIKTKEVYFVLSSPNIFILLLIQGVAVALPVYFATNR